MKSLEKMYVSLVLPLIEYCDSVWDKATYESKNKLDAIHVEAARTVTGATKLCSVEKLLTDLGWDTLQARRNKHKLVIFYKLINGISPDYLRDFVPPLVQETTRYSLRHSNDIQTMAANLFTSSTIHFSSYYQSLEFALR
ncbi:MAG: hypothetical protein N0E59_13095 [Candidatus Thiodiazotropha taylori]|nr:hypothetical protein [Candidatus Thiodiazotropha taylori]MCW4284045.1 hypothetical protein [Candidatus Thiodiazotropha taylori]